MADNDILKGNFKVKNPVKLPEKTTGKENHAEIADELRKQALRALGGSMVYVDRKTMVWDGDE